ncbi:site-specific integrase [Planomicrobium sp. YIM 101495]|uniref:site-specific integrase n=1 Tax=Planomicrobium sp. YIM 101495 TaxID=2665160 RepID=UPI0012B76736|nr:site-specific integrase [Planomicrobium sp. YIM 101495]MTD29885.1 recombinase XerC [Planomicrobium sp. YIM 101495]
MPYGYEKYRLKNGISPNTVIHEVQLIRTLLAYLNRKYKKPVEPHEIRPRDIQQFLLEQRKTGIKDSTLNRKIVFIRQWFDYMWRVGRIPADFMPKFKFSEKLDLSPPDIHLDYQVLLDKKNAVLSSDLPLNAKVLYILYLRGLRLRDMTSINIGSFEDLGHSMKLTIEKKDGYVSRLKFVGKEILIMNEAIERAVFRGTDYLLSSKVDGRYTAFHLGSLSDYTEALSTFVGMPIRSGDIRFAYVHYLYAVEDRKLEEIQEILGVSLDSAARILKDSITRLKPTVPESE